MSDDLLRQLSDYGRDHDERQSAVMLADLGPATAAADDVARSTGVHDGREIGRRLLLAAAAVILVAVAAILLTLRTGDPDSVELVPVAPSPPAPTAPPPNTVTPAPTAPPSTIVSPITPGESAEAEVLGRHSATTPVGDIDVIVLRGDARFLPDSIPVQTPEGFVAASADGQLLTSDDRVTWSLASSPVPGRVSGLDTTDEGFVLRTDSGSWNTTDFVSWSRDEAEHLLPGVIDGDELQLWERFSHELASGATFSHVLVVTDWAALALRVGGPELQSALDDGAVLDFDHRENARVAVQLIELGEEGPGRPVDTGIAFTTELSGTPDAWRFEVIAEGDGQPLTTITGSTPDSDLDAIGIGLSEGLLSLYVVSDGATIEPTVPPWRSPEGPSNAETMALDGVLYTIEGRWFVPGDERVWRSRDGRSWEDLGHPGWDPSLFLSGPPAVANGVAVATLWDEDERFEIVRSTDGVTWSAAIGPPLLTGENPHATVVALDRGFVLAPNAFETDDAIWVSVDGDTWEQVDTGSTPMLGPATADGGGGSGASTDGAVRRLEGQDGTATVWLIQYPG